MCASNALEGAAIVATGGLAAPFFMQKKMQRKQEEAQQGQINAQNAKNEVLRKEAEALGPAAKAIDLTKEPNVYNDLKKNKMALQAGIMGTVKTNPLSSAPTAQTQKTTLGS